MKSFFEQFYLHKKYKIGKKPWSVVKHKGEDLQPRGRGFESWRH